MNPEEQRIAIAEACGWTPTPEGLYTKDPAGLRPPFRHPEHLPNYLNDLNAMHEAERRLTDDQWGLYCVALNKLACRIQCGNTHTCGYTIAATAAQRAEAFLKTLNLWKP
jgi:hypothetical protein